MKKHTWYTRCVNLGSSFQYFSLFNNLIFLYLKHIGILGIFIYTRRKWYSHISRFYFGVLYYVLELIIRPLMSKIMGGYTVHNNMF